MAKIKFPLYSKEVRGSIFGQLTFSNKKAGQQCRTQKAQTDYLNPAREYVRYKFKTSSDWWKFLTPAEQLTFANYSKNDI